MKGKDSKKNDTFKSYLRNMFKFFKKIQTCFSFPWFKKCKYHSASQPKAAAPSIAASASFSPDNTISTLSL